MRLEQVLLLLIRTLIVLFLATALARPTTESLAEYFQTEGPKHRILVIDATYSMGYAPSGRTQFDRAKDLARQIIKSSHKGDAFNLVRISDSLPRVIVKRPAYQTSAIIEEIEQMTLLDERTDASNILKEIDELLSRAPELSQKEVYFLTDLQTATWSPANSSEAIAVRQELKRISERAKIVWLDVGEPSSSNLAVTSIRSEDQYVLTGRPARTSATLRNFGKLAVPAQQVELLIDDRLTDTRRVDLPADQSAEVEFSPTFSAGDHRVEVRMTADSLPVDNSRRLAIPVRDELQVLLINGKPSGEPMGNATDFLKLALAPELPNRVIASSIRPTVIREGELLGTDLSRFDAVFVCNVALLTDREAEVLRSYLDAGGGVVFCLGDLVRIENYNQVLQREQRPILPAKLIERVGDIKKKETAFEFDAADFQHPIVRPFQGNPGAGLEQTKTFVYVKTEVDNQRGAQVAMRFSSGDPAIIDAPFGRGRVILITTSVDREWSTWAVWGHSLIPLMHETVNAAVAGRWAGRDVLVGQPLMTHFGLRGGDAASTYQLPNGETRPLQPSTDGRTVTTEPTTSSGFHKIILGPPANRTDWFGVNVDTQESDLTALRLDDLRNDILPGIDFRYLTEWEEAVESENEKIRVASTGTPLARWFLVAAAVLLVVEQLMAWHFVAGASLLAAMVSAVMVSNVWKIHWSFGAILLAITVIALVMVLNRFRSAVRI